MLIVAFFVTILIVTLLFAFTQISRDEWLWQYYTSWSPNNTGEVPRTTPKHEKSRRILAILIGFITLMASTLFQSNVQQSLMLLDVPDEVMDSKLTER